PNLEQPEQRSQTGKSQQAGDQPAVGIKVKKRTTKCRQGRGEAGCDHCDRAVRAEVVEAVRESSEALSLRSQLHLTPVYTGITREDCERRCLGAHVSFCTVCCRAGNVNRRVCRLCGNLWFLEGLEETICLWGGLAWTPCRTRWSEKSRNFWSGWQRSKCSSSASVACSTRRLTSARSKTRAKSWDVF